MLKINIKSCNKTTQNPKETWCFYRNAWCSKRFNIGHYRVGQEIEKEIDKMGMSSSQARLLTLTARMHDIEYRAQRLEAQKLQMANESRRVYENYLEALDARKIQYKGINADGSITFRDATLRSLENGAVPGLEGEFSYKPFLLKNGMTDEIYITPEFAEYYGINPDNMEPLGTLDEYLERNHVPQVPIMEPVYGPDYTKVLSATPIENVLVQGYIPAVDPTPGTWEISQVLPQINISNTTTTSTFNQPTSIPAPTVTYGTMQVIHNLNDYPEPMCSYDGTTNTLNVGNESVATNLLILSLIGNDERTYPPTYRQELYSWFNSSSNLSIENRYKFCKILESVMADAKNGDTSSAKTFYNAIKQYITGNTSIPDDFDFDALAESLDIEIADIPIDENTSLVINELVSDPTSWGASWHYVSNPNDPQALSTNAYSINDIKTLLAQALVDNNYYSNLNDALNSQHIAGMQGLTNFQYAVIAYMLASGSLDNAILHELESGQIDNSTFIDYAPEGWSEIGEEFINFSTTDKCPVTTTTTLNYEYSREAVIKQIAYDLYSKYGTIPDEDKINEITTGLQGLSDYQLGALFNARQGTTDWNEILEIIENGNYNNSQLSSYTLPANIDYVHFGNTNVTLEEVGGDDGEPEQLAQYQIPGLGSIASNILVALRKRGYDVDDSMQSTIYSKLNQLYTSLGVAEGNKYLAFLNDDVCKYLLNSNNSNIITEIYNFIQGASDAPSLSSFNSTLPQNAIYTMNTNPAEHCQAEYGEKIIDYRETGEMTWDVDSEEYKEYTQKYYVLKSMEGSKYKIIDDEELLNSTEFVSNWLTLNEGYLLEFDPKTNEMVDTNVAVNTNLQEIEDEKDLKKAEAKYEADMKRIDMKDRRYDTQLAALDNERNAVKQEMETLKTVAKDNVDRTFRLFS